MNEEEGKINRGYSQCNFRVRLYDTCHEHIFTSIDDIEDKVYNLLDFNARRKWKAKYLGECAMSMRVLYMLIILC